MLCVAKTRFYKTKKKSLIVWVDLELKLILCLWGKIQKVCKGYKRDSTKTSAQAGGRLSEKKHSKKDCEKETDCGKDVEVE